MAAASGELELRASLIAHVLPSVASLFRIARCKFLQVPR